MAQLEAAADPETFQRNIRNLYEPFEVAKSVSKRYYSVDSRCCNEPLDTSLRYQNYSCKIRRLPIMSYHTHSFPGMLLIKNAGILNSLVDNKAQSVAIYTAISESLLQVDNLIVASCTQPLQLPKLDCHHDISHNMSIVAAVFNLCLKGLIQLCQDISGRQQYKGVAISHLVHCIKRVLCHLQDMCIVVTKYAETGQEIRLVPHSQQSHDARVRSMLVTALSDLIADIFLCPLFAISTNTSIIHPAVTEALTGTLSVFLQRLGGCVSEKVFGDHLPSSSNPGHITKLQERVVPASHTAAIELEGANLVEILRRIMQSGDGKLLKLLADSPGDRQTTSNSGNGEIVLQSIKKQLQDTLMVGIFGDDGKDFLDTLKVPQSKELPPADHGSFMRVADGSFVNSVSDLLGWNLAFEHI